MIPVGERNARVAGRPATRCNTRHHLEWHFVPRQQFYFLTAAAKYKRVPTFEPGDALALQGEVQQQLIDFHLG